MFYGEFYMSMTNNSNIFKLSASLYSMNSSEYSQSDILLHIVKCNFINMDNKSMKYNEVIASVLENYQINITKDELTALLKRYALGKIKINLQSEDSLLKIE